MDGSPRRGDGPAAVTVRLPEAAPRDYLRWMTFWRDARTALTHARSDTEVPSSLVALFDDPMAGSLAAMADAITTQAVEAERSGSGAVAPVITIPTVGDAAAACGRMAEALIRRRAILPTQAPMIGLEPPDGPVTSLRDAVIFRIVETSFRHAVDQS